MTVAIVVTIGGLIFRNRFPAAKPDARSWPERYNSKRASVRKGPDSNGMRDGKGRKTALVEAGTPKTPQRTPPAEGQAGWKATRRYMPVSSHSRTISGKW